MTWPGWGDVLPLLTTLVTVIGAVVTWVRISDRTVSQAVEKVARQSEKAAREAAAGVSAEVKALAEKLATSDFPHVEARIERGLAAARADREAMESRIGERLDRTGGRIERMGGRLDRMGGAHRTHGGPASRGRSRDGDPDPGGGSAASGYGRLRIRASDFPLLLRGSRQGGQGGMSGEIIAIIPVGVVPAGLNVTSFGALRTDGRAAR